MELPIANLWIGIAWRDEQWSYQPNQLEVEHGVPLQLLTRVVHTTFQSPHGIIYGTALRRLPCVKRASWGLLIRWLRRSRSARCTTHETLVSVHVYEQFRRL